MTNMKKDANSGGADDKRQRADLADLADPRTRSVAVPLAPRPEMMRAVADHSGVPLDSVYAVYHAVLVCQGGTPSRMIH